MSDAALRALEQAFRTSGSPEDERTYLHALRRAGLIDLSSLRVAAYLGDETAEAALGGGLAAHAPRSGVKRFLEQLPGDDGVHLRAGAAAGRALAALVSLSAEAEASLYAATRWLEDPSPTTVAAAKTCAAAQPVQLAPGPVVDLSQAWRAGVSGLDMACWILAARASGALSFFPWGDFLFCFAESVPRGRSAEQAVRAEVRAVLLPWVLLRAPSEQGIENLVSVGMDAALLGGVVMTPAEAKAVQAAGPGGGGRPKVADARKVIEGFFRARGFGPYRGSLVNADRTRKVKLMKRSVQMLEGRPGAWTKVAGTRGREVLLTDAAEHLIRLAQMTLDQG